MTTATSVTSTQPMTPIKNWDDATPFRDKIVAYQTVAPYFGAGAGMGYTTDGTYFGYVAKEPTTWQPITANDVNSSLNLMMAGITPEKPEEGYRLIRFARNEVVTHSTEEANPIFCKMMNTILKTRAISMRFATRAELGQLEQLLRNKTAYFEYADNPRVLFTGTRQWYDLLDKVEEERQEIEVARAEGRLMPAPSPWNEYAYQASVKKFLAKQEALKQVESKQ